MKRNTYVRTLKFWLPRALRAQTPYARPDQNKQKTEEKWISSSLFTFILDMHVQQMTIRKYSKLVPRTSPSTLDWERPGNQIGNTSNYCKNPKKISPGLLQPGALERSLKLIPLKNPKERVLVYLVSCEMQPNGFVGMRINWMWRALDSWRWREDERYEDSNCIVHSKHNVKNKKNLGERLLQF